MKNLIILIACLTIQLSAIAQTNIKIILKTDLQIDSVDAFDVSFKEFHTFKFRDTLNMHFNKENIDLYNIRYFVKGKMYRQQIWLDTGNIIIKGHTDKLNLVIDTVINSPVYYSVINYLKTSPKPLNAQDSIERNRFYLNEIQKNIENPRSIAIAIDYINFNQNSKPNLLKLKLLLSKQKEDFSWFIFYQMGIERMNKILEIKNIHLLDFMFVDRQNKIVNLDLNKYDYCVLDFWFVGCVPCMEQHKLIKTDYLKLRDKKIGLIGISTVSNFDEWHKYLSKHDYNWENYLQSGPRTLSDFLSINACPVYVLLNKKGEIMGSFNSWSEVLDSLKLINN
jgi:Thioredoxin-like